MESEKEWKSDGKSCPGIGKGCKIPFDEIERNIEENEQNIPVIIFKGKINPYK